jgi:hypothetical protein
MGVVDIAIIKGTKSECFKKHRGTTCLTKPHLAIA